MKLKTIKIGPIIYKIQEVRDLHYVDDDGKKQWLHGRVRYKKKIIEVGGGQNKQVNTCVLVHESLHALLYQAGIDDEPENLVRSLGYSLVQFMRDNPELVDRIMKHG